MKINITVPARNESKTLLLSIPFLIEHLSNYFEDQDWFVVVADNGSNDDTGEKIIKLQKQYSNLFFLSRPEPGRGGALVQSWQQFPADFLGYIDADLDIHPEALKKAFLKLLQGFDIALGSRLHPLGDVSQFFHRKMMSFVARGLVKNFFHTSYYDTQCGMKMLKAQTFHELYPYLKETGWFLDTEMVLTAIKRKYKLAAVPVDYVTNRLGFRRSKVSTSTDSWDFLACLYRLKRKGL